MDTVDKLDLAFGTLGGAALDMGSQWYSDATLRSVFENLEDPSKNPSSKAFKRDVTKDVQSQYTPTRANRYRSGYHPFRERFNMITGGLVNTVEDRAVELGKEESYRKAGRALDSNGRIKGVGQLSTKQADQVRNAMRFRTLSTGIAGIWGISLGASIAGGAINSIREMGAAAQGNKWKMNNEGFYDSSMAHTTRQRALRAIQNSQSGHRRAFGQEANFLHSYR